MIPDSGSQEPRVWYSYWNSIHLHLLFLDELELHIAREIEVIQTMKLI